MTQLSRRQETILGLIVREYVKTPVPIGSRTLVDRYGLTYSSATIRNDMAELEELGLIAAPHTSAGRIPTEAGYRYFVQKLINDSELTGDELRMISHQFHQVRTDVRQWLQLAASVLAQTVRSASLVTAPTFNSARFQHLELVSTVGRQVLLILVLDRGLVRQQMLTLAEPVSQNLLSEVADRINAVCIGYVATEIRSKNNGRPALDQEIMELAADLLERASRNHETIYTDGLMNILDPTYLMDRIEFSDIQNQDEMARLLAQSDLHGARQALHFLEEQSLLEEVLNEALLPDVEGVQVMIAGEGRWEELSHTSMVVSKYGMVGQATGALAVLGPTRLHYGRAISAVRFVAGLMNDMMIDIYGDGADS